MRVVDGVLDLDHLQESVAAAHSPDEQLKRAHLVPIDDAGQEAESLSVLVILTAFQI